MICVEGPMSISWFRDLLRELRMVNVQFSDAAVNPRAWSPRAWSQKLVNFFGEQTSISCENCEWKRPVFNAVNPRAWPQKLVNFFSETKRRWNFLASGIKLDFWAMITIDQIGGIGEMFNFSSTSKKRCFEAAVTIRGLQRILHRIGEKRMVLTAGRKFAETESSSWFFFLIRIMAADFEPQSWYFLVGENV